MALDINPVDFRGFSLGAPSTPQLPNVGALGLQAVQIRLADQQAKRDAAIQQARIRSADEAMLRQGLLERERLAQQNDQFNQSRDLDEKKLRMLASKEAMDAKIQQADLALKERGYGVQMRGQDVQERIATGQLNQDYIKTQLAQLQNKKKEELDNMGAFAASGLLAMKQAKNPTEAALMRNNLVDEAVQNGFIPAEAGKSFKQMPLSAFNNALNHYVILTDTAGKLKALAPEQEKGDVTLSINPDGTVQYSSKATTANETKLQDEIKSKESALNQFEQIQSGYKPEYFTDRGQLDAWAARQAERKKGLPVLEQGAEYLASTLTNMSSDERAKFLTERKGYFNKVDQLYNSYKKEITGQAAGEKELEQIKNSFINGDMSPSEFKGALEQVVSKYKYDVKASKEILNQGIDTSPDPLGIR